MRHGRITIDPEQMGGVPCIRGLRIPVETVVAMLSQRMSRKEILAAYPDLEAEDIPEAQRFSDQCRLHEELEALGIWPRREVSDNARLDGVSKLKAIAAKARRQDNTVVLCDAYNALARFYGFNGHGLRWYRKALRCFPESGGYHLNVASCLLTMGRNKEGLSFLFNAHKLGVLTERELREFELAWGKR